MGIGLLNAAAAGLAAGAGEGLASYAVENGKDMREKARLEMEHKNRLEELGKSNELATQRDLTVGAAGHGYRTSENEQQGTIQARNQASVSDATATREKTIKQMDIDANAPLRDAQRREAVARTGLYENEAQNTDRFQWQPGTGVDENGKEVSGAYRFPTRGDGEPTFFGGVKITAKTGGGRDSVYAQKQQAWLAVHPDDPAGALEYAGGKRQMSDAEVMLASQRLATSQLGTGGIATDKEIDARAAKIADGLKAARANPGNAPAAPPAPGAPIPKPAAPAATAAPQYPDAPVDPTQRETGKTYRAPNGRVGKWTGTGWQLVQ